MGPGLPSLLQRLERISHERPDRVLRLRGRLPLELEGAAEMKPDGLDAPGEAAAAQADAWEPFELLIFRGFSSSVTHPTAYDPDQSALPPGAELASAELLAGPLDPSNERVLVAATAVEAFLDPATWA
ncbi:hypothetical protein KBY97_13750 [Synechococcus sp. ATX 2A4]|uniref:DUF7734 family protein n=1 Tax=Synechococcus sp. ATX 2A4 TaxID=2823727 RepID=UPI0020CE0982|nr:hypothetical protein [Synechococcus sp. ATX 2A4]MCP9886178.1 hypothetical protein [Synechococcus sp. ATX 2A4]